MIDNILTSLVKIINKNNNTIKGTGFFIGNQGYILTCHHVIFELDELWIEYDTQQIQAIWSKKFSNLELDIAILKVNISPYSLPLFDIPNVSSNKVILCGFPSIKNNNFPNGYAIQNITIYSSTPIRTLSTFSIISNKKLSNLWNRLPKEDSTFSSFQIDTKQPHGMSGGLVYDVEHKGIIGIIQSSSNTEEFSYAIRLSNLFDYLDEADFKILGIRMSKKDNTTLDILDELKKFGLMDLKEIAREIKFPQDKRPENPTSQQFRNIIYDWAEIKQKLDRLKEVIIKKHRED